MRKYFNVVDEGGNASVNNITINRAGSDLINGETTTIINTDYQSISLFGTGSRNSWNIF